jgi:hypothetical protein
VETGLLPSGSVLPKNTNWLIVAVLSETAADTFDAWFPEQNYFTCRAWMWNASAGAMSKISRGFLLAH